MAVTEPVTVVFPLQGHDLRVLRTIAVVLALIGDFCRRYVTLRGTTWWYWPRGRRGQTEAVGPTGLIGLKFELTVLNSVELWSRLAAKSRLNYGEGALPGS